jgi:hypothetical protein
MTAAAAKAVAKQPYYAVRKITATTMAEEAEAEEEVETGRQRRRQGRQRRWEQRW